MRDAAGCDPRPRAFSKELEQIDGRCTVPIPLSCWASAGRPFGSAQDKLCPHESKHPYSLDIFRVGVPFDFAHGRLSTRAPFASSRRASLGMTRYNLFAKAH